MNRTLAALALGLLSWASASSPAAAAEVDTPNVSGLPWRSGVSSNGNSSGFAAWRDRPLDAKVLFAPHATWDQMTRQLRGGYFRKNCSETPLCVVSLAMFPKSANGQFGPCAGGS